MTTLQHRYATCMVEYSNKFCKIAGIDGEWNLDHSVFFCTDETRAPYSSEEIRYIVDNRQDLEERLRGRATIADKLDEWNDYVMDCIDLHIQYINLRSWMMGAPRISKTERERLRGLKDSLEKEIEQAQKEFGKLQTDIPEHKRKDNNPY